MLIFKFCTPLHHTFTDLNNIAGEVVGYEYQANTDEDAENRESEELDNQESNTNAPVIVIMQKNKSAPLAFVKSQKNSSFHERYLGVTSIQEDDMEDTLRSASPNFELNNNNHKLFMWRTQKEVSNDDYNELSEHCNDYEQIEVYDQYISSMKRAISERNVMPIPRRESKFKRFFSASKHDEDEDSVSDTESDAIEIKKGNMTTQFRSQTQDAVEFDFNEVMTFPVKSYNEETSTISKGEKQSSVVKGNFSQNKTNSCVDIDTIGGKVSSSILIFLDGNQKSHRRGETKAGHEQTQKIFTLSPFISN